mgnify:CR=1 FL=1
MARFKYLMKPSRKEPPVLTGTVEYTAGCHIGSRRTNQDNLRAGSKCPLIKARSATLAKGTIQLQDMDLFCVCDGVGGGYRGDLAAKYALKAIKRYLKTACTPQLSLRTIALEAAERAQAEVCGFYETAQKAGGCTLSMIALRGDHYVYLNIGDSPGFLIPFDGTIFELSQRHNLAWEKLRMGLPAREGDSSRLLNYLGMEGMSAQNIAYVTEGHLSVGDHILLCTDGVSSTFSPPSLEKSIRNKTTAGQITKAAAAMQDADNCTAVCLTVTGIHRSSHKEDHHNGPQSDSEI